MEPIKILLRRDKLNYAPKSQARVPTRTCQGHIVNTDLPTLGTSPEPIQSGSTTQEAKDSQEAKDLGDLQWSGWTVRREGADCPQAQGRPSEMSTRTTSSTPRKTDCP
jgi:hypothetical protein